MEKFFQLGGFIPIAYSLLLKEPIFDIYLLAASQIIGKYGEL